MNPQKISILDYTYPLPNEKIAFHPLSQRDESRLLIYSHDTLQEDHYKNIAGYLPSDSLIILTILKL